jgi:hypothetical protein
MLTYAYIGAGAVRCRRHRPQHTSAYVIIRQRMLTYAYAGAGAVRCRRHRLSVHVYLRKPPRKPQKKQTPPLCEWSGGGGSGSGGGDEFSRGSGKSAGLQRCTKVATFGEGLREGAY